MPDVGARGYRVLRMPALLAVVLASVVLVTPAEEREPVPAPPIAPVAATAQAPLFSFVSMPDFLNADIGDVRVRAGVGWDPGDPNSINDSWTRALDVILDDVQARGPAAVLVAGDLVEGHWGVDIRGTGTFGPVRTRRERLAAIRNAGNVYYPQWKQRFTERGLRVLPAVGDHEIGDNPWREGTFKLAAVPTYKRVWAKTFTRTPTGHRFGKRPVGTPFESTAYAVRIQNTLFVTVDIYKRTREGVQLTVDGGQLAWLDRTLGRARRSGVTHLVVQGHAPVVGPVRSTHSSEMTMSGGRYSPFWRVLQRHDVDLYLAGEMHAMTSHAADGVVQVVHGALATLGQANYLVGRVYPRRIELELRRFRGRVTDERHLWNTDRKRPHRGVSFRRGSVVVGTMVIDKRSGVTMLRDQSGRLRTG